MKYSLAVSTVLLGVAACGNGNFDNSSTLLGTWVDGGSLVVATPAALLLSLPCGGQVRVSHAVRLDDGSFSVMDTLRGSVSGGLRDTLPGHPLRPARFYGTLVGNQLNIRMQSGPPAGISSFDSTDIDLFHGHPGKTPGDVICRA